MEIPACGAFMLAERTTEHMQLFEEGREADFFDIENQEELYQKVIYWLKNNDKRLNVAARGRARCISSNYSHEDTVKYMLNKIKGLAIE